MLRAKPLEEWITLGEASKILSVSPQAVHQMCESGVIPEEYLRRVGYGKPIFLVFQSYVTDLVEQRREAAADKEVRLEKKDASRARRQAAGKPQLEFMAEK